VLCKKYLNVLSFALFAVIQHCIYVGYMLLLLQITSPRFAMLHNLIKVMPYVVKYMHFSGSHSQLEVFREHIFHASCLRYVAHNFHLVVHMARTHSSCTDYQADSSDSVIMKRWNLML
jgi:hypothetical protein